MGYTLQQLQQMGAKPVGVSPRGGKGQTLQQLQAQGATPVVNNGFPTEEPPAVKQSFMQRLGLATKLAASQTANMVGNTISGIGHTADPFVQAAGGAVRAIQATPDVLRGVAGNAQAAQQAKEIMAKPIFGQDTYAGQTPVQNLGSALEVGSNLIGLGEAGTVKSVVTGAAKRAIKTGGVQGAVQGLGGYLEGGGPHNAGDATMAALKGAGQGAVMGGVGAKMQPLLTSELSNPKSAAYKLTHPKDTLNVTKNLESKYIAQAKSDWSKPSTESKPAYKKAAEVYKAAATRGHDIADTLIRNKLSPSDHIENGNYNTLETADRLRSDAIKASNEMLRPSLEKADIGTSKTPVADVIKQSVDNLNRNRSLTAETREVLIEKLKKTEAALAKKYPDGMSLVDLHDEKIVRDSNAKYSPVGDIATNNEAVKNKAVADASRKILEDRAPQDVPVREFNSELAKQHQAANYLEALNGKKAPVSLKSKVANTTAKVAGAAVGHAIGGGVLGGVGGYHVGGMIENMIESMPNPIRSRFLENMQVTNPEAFVKLQEYLAGPDPIAKGDTITSVVKPADLGNKPLPKTIKVNDYQNPDYPRYIPAEAVQRQERILEAKKHAGKPIDITKPKGQYYSNVDMPKELKKKLSDYGKPPKARKSK